MTVAAESRSPGEEGGTTPWPNAFLFLLLRLR